MAVLRSQTQTVECSRIYFRLVDANNDDVRANHSIVHCIACANKSLLIEMNSAISLNQAVHQTELSDSPRVVTNMWF